MTKIKKLKIRNPKEEETAKNLIRTINILTSASLSLKHVVNQDSETYELYTDGEIDVLTIKKMGVNDISGQHISVLQHVCSAFETLTDAKINIGYNEENSQWLLNCNNID